ncbi:MAG TPA: hypothetical protein DIT11_00535 [Ruminococcaceae bacterium]|nr:hypothetical protein [Oscillospiraceae bacterium]
MGCAFMLSIMKKRSKHRVYCAFGVFRFLLTSNKQGFQKIKRFFGKRKNICSIITKLCFVLYGICFDEVQQSSQENEIQNLSQQPTECI